jgi:hypothetical protein
METLNKVYRPIKVDLSAPRGYEGDTTRAKFCRFIMRLQKKLHLLIYCDLTYEKQIDTQLKDRIKFPQQEWEQYFTVANVEIIRKTLKESTDTRRVNNHYIPSDLLLYLLWDDVESNNVDNFVLDIKKFFGVEISPEEIVKMAKDNITLKDFFNKVIKVVEVV